MRLCFLISETSYWLNGILKLCTTQADICVKPDIDYYWYEWIFLQDKSFSFIQVKKLLSTLVLHVDVELISNDTVAELILHDLDRALVTHSFSCFPLRFYRCATSFLNKLVPELVSECQLVQSNKVCPFDSSVCFAPSCVFTAASVWQGDLDI